MMRGTVHMKHFLTTSLILVFATAAPFWGGVWAQTGKFTPPTYQEVISEYNQKADHATAYEIGVFYYFAMRGAPKDYAKARQWFLKAANQGSHEAHVKLGDMYYFGRGVNENRQEALQFYRKAAEMENPEGQEKLADIYYFGSGVDRNYITAEKWCRKAAMQVLWSIWQRSTPKARASSEAMWKLTDGWRLSSPGKIIIPHGLFLKKFLKGLVEIYIQFTFTGFPF